ncbi:MAG: recombinase family protein [Pirellulales bacterium]
MCKIVAYYRVSTKRQGESGLGLEGQQSAVESYGKASGCNLLAAYTEVESGRRSDRPELAKAFAHAKSARAIVVIAKLDRLARNVAFTATLMESGTDFVCCDNPNANPFTIHILAAAAEDESRRIRERTKAALAAAKRRGTKLGSSRPGHWEGREHRRQAGQKRATAAAAKSRTANANAANALVVQIVAERRANGVTWQAIADGLNEAGHVTQRGGKWIAQTVRQLAKRMIADWESVA